MLLTISGLYGSGGNELGMDLAEMLGYKVYDNTIIEQARKDSGLDLKNTEMAFIDEQDEKIDEQIDDKPYRNAILKLQMDVLPIGRTRDLPASEHANSGLISSFLSSAPFSRKKGSFVTKKSEIDALRFAQAKLILEAADEGNGIFFGRCSSYILKGRKDTINIFTYASMKSCVKRISELYGIEDLEQVEELCKKTNRRRAYYYETFTGQKWDDIENYDFCLNTDYLGYDGTLDFIKELVEIRSEQL